MSATIQLIYLLTKFSITMIVIKINTSLVALREKCPQSEVFCSVFSHIWTEYGEIWIISPYSVRMGENKEQKNSDYGHFSHCVDEANMLQIDFT